MPDRNNRNQIDRGDQAPQLQSTTGRPLPNNIEAEKSVLAACMLNPDAVDEIADVVQIARDPCQLHGPRRIAKRLQNVLSLLLH